MRGAGSGSLPPAGSPNGTGAPNGVGGGAPATELIFGDWYPAVRTDTIARKGQTETTLLLGFRCWWGGRTTAACLR